jgi:hypothetical protein
VELLKMQFFKKSKVARFLEKETVFFLIFIDCLSQFFLTIIG